MIVFIFLAARLSSENEPTSQTNDCAYLMQQCLIDRNGCEQSWRSLEDTCIVPGDSCKINNSSYCKLSVQSLVEKNFQFKECLCIDDLHCTVNKLFGKKCINQTEESTLPSDLVPRSNVTRGFQGKDTSLMAERKDDCVTAAETCQESENCSLLHENFKKACGKGTAQCHTLSGQQLCVALRESLRETVLWDCQCGSPLEGDCIRIWKSLFEDICIQDTPINQIPTFSQDNQDNENRFKEGIASGFRQMQSCLEVTEACVGDVVCNAQLALYLKACSANGNLCDVKHCQAAIRFFYQNMPFNTAQMLAFCDCAQSDIPCQQSKETLHSKPCALNIVPPPTCLSVIHTCRNDELCRTHYRTFQSECWPRVTGKCQEDEACISTLSKQDLTCSGSDSCRVAYLGTFGTVLQVPCACRSITQNEEPLCMTFQHMLRSKSCFNYPTPNGKDISSYKRKRSKEINLTGFASPFNGELVYAVLCMVVTCGILFLVMLKLRISSKKRDPSPIEIAGGVITQ
ncbi:GDNF family receptor alpha-like [Phodopus roborovskii]|uniref:GDNF family receptor alpha-like n=1 Tax=Phodopus roborovskii TaxID=109678 RepID=UPI0021E3A717|nr:GDNF family receptor alpha-like [Phodopus roborovskii]